MELNPSVLFVSCSDSEPADYLIRLILGELPPVSYSEEGLVSYPWYIDTKYYEADVTLSALKTKTLCSPEFARSVHGFIIYFDSEKPSCLRNIEEWLLFLNDYEAEVKILACMQCSDGAKDVISKREIQEWCLEKGFELVELNPVCEENDTEMDCFETTGVKRICQALHAHVWPNLVMKDRKEPTDMSGLLHGGRCESTGANYEDMSCVLTPDNIEPSLEEIIAQNDVDFCSLFSQFASMKDKAANMPSEERKKFAEKLVLSYWNAIGGDEDEILDC